MYVVKFRRHIEGKTDYKARASLLESGLPRLVVRKTNLYIIAQIVSSKEAQDKVICTANSKELLSYGAEGSLKNIQAAYLTGFLIAHKIRDKIKKAILDLGLQRSTKGSRCYAVLKGVLDAGLEVPHSKGMLPSEERVQGKNLKKSLDIEKIKQQIISKWKK